MNFVGALTLLSLLAVLPTHTSTNFLEPLSTDELDSHFDLHVIRRLWINSGYLHQEPEIFSYFQLLEKFEQMGQVDNISLSSSEVSTNETTSTENHLHLLAGTVVRAFCNNVVLQRRPCGKLQQCTELQKNETESRVNQWCHNVAERVEKEPFGAEVMKLLDSISDPGSLSQNANLTSNSSNISIEWGLENPEMGILFKVTAFQVSYCPLKKPKEWSCYGEWQELTVEGKDGVLKTTIGNLEANRKYKVAVVSLFENKMRASETRYKYVRTKNVTSNGSAMASAFHRICVVFSALLWMFFYW